MRIEVYERELDAVEAAADEIAARVAAAGDGAAVALPGGRPSRALLAALAEHAEVPWASTRWFVTDERCGDATMPDATRDLVLGTALAPNRVSEAALSAPAREDVAETAAETWDAAVRTVGNDRGGFDVVALAAHADGSVAGLAPGAAAEGWVVATPDGRVSLGTEALRTARAVVVVATGAALSGPVAEACVLPLDPRERPLQLVLPDEGRVIWFVDRAAATRLIEGAREIDLAP